MRHVAAVPASNGTSKKSGNKQTAPPVRRRLLSKSKDDILNQPKRIEESKMNEKELERTMKWRDMAVIDRPDGSIHYRFPLTKKVISSVNGIKKQLVQRTFKGIPDCWRTTVWHEFLTAQATKRGDRESEHDLIQSYYVMIHRRHFSDRRFYQIKIVMMTRKSTLTSLAQSANIYSSANDLVKGASLCVPV